MKFQLSRCDLPFVTATYDEQYEGQLAVLLLNGLLYKGHEMYVSYFY